ncbi:hypothetical protein BFO01nite_26550 [Brevibacillus formosus]|uniref:Uncharacterized protein n=1 Tax=Brevibacillus formosus TaxID=54913 RepID=A0ABQ0TBR0_9BACL|nr:hypothetical protein BFO01nite_26550 [Brevibacillus formosus]
MSQHSGGEEKAQFSSTLTRPQGGLTGRLHLKKGTVEPKPPYGRKFLKEEVFDNRVPFLSSDWVGVVKVCELCAFSSQQLCWFIGTF